MNAESSLLLRLQHRLEGFLRNIDRSHTSKRTNPVIFPERDRSMVVEVMRRMDGLR